MIEVLFKASLAIGIALAFYKLVLQQESFFATNRFYLLSCILLAFALPFITLPKLINQQGYLNSLFEKEVVAEVKETAPVKPSLEFTPVVAQEPEIIFETPAVIPSEPVSSTSTSEDLSVAADPEVLPVQQTSYSFSFWLLMLYLFGVAIFSLSLLYQIGVVVYTIITAKEKYRDDNCIIISTSKKQAPCSFFNYIFIYPDEYDFKTYEQIIAHEKIHVKLGHSLDMLLAELAVIILWFNPLIWLFRKEIEKNNEYQTDATLLEEEQFLKENYQLNLLQIAVPNKPLNITTNYNQSLIKQRIMKMNSKRSAASAYWKYAFLLPLFFGMLLLVNEPAVSQENKKSSPASKSSEPTPEVIQETNQVVVQEINVDEEISTTVSEMRSEEIERTRERVRETLPATREILNSSRDIASLRVINTNIQGRNNDMTKGFWYSSRKGDEYCIQFKGSADNSTWNMSRCFDVNDFQKKGPETFVMTKESGTMELTGNLDAEVGQGKYVFTADPEFSRYLTNNNISSNNENLVFHLFFGNVGKSYIDFLKQQYQEVDGDRLLELAIHGVSQESFKNYIALFQKHSNKKPSIREVVEARIHRIDEAYVQEIQKMGFTDLPLRKMMEAKIHNVSTSYVESLKNAGYTNLSMDKIISAKIHGVDPATIKEMKALGKGGEMSIDKVIELQIHRVSADYIQQLESAGLTNLSLDQVVSAKIHGLDPASIKELRSLGYSNLSFNDMLSAQIHRVDAEYVNSLREAGLTNLSLDEVTTAKIHRLDPQSIKEIRALGFKDLSFNDLMSAQIHRVNAEYVKDLQKTGLENLDINDVVSARIHGIDSEFIENARKNGYNLNSINKYISLKIHGSAMESLKDN